MAGERITNDKLFEVLIALRGEVGEQTGMMRSLQTSFGDEKLRVRAGEIAMESRVRGIEHRVYGVSFAAGILGAVAGYFGFHIKL